MVSLQQFVPFFFQKEKVRCTIISEDSSTATTIHIFAIFFGLSNLVLGILTIKYRKKKVIVYGQVSRIVAFFLCGDYVGCIYTFSFLCIDVCSNFFFRQDCASYLVLQLRFSVSKPCHSLAATPIRPA